MSNGPTSTTRKETVYSGPDVDLFKPKQRESAKSTEEPKKETVFQGDAPEFITRRFSKSELAQAAKLQSETVHQGPIPEMFAKLGRIAHDLVMPDRETIYSGPEVTFRKVVDVSHQSAGAAGDNQAGAKKETVFDEATFVAKRVDSTAARSLVTRMVQRASVRFFAVAILSGIELYFCRDNYPIAISSGSLALTFCVVGFYTYKLNLKALLFAIGIYACTTLFMAANAIMTDRMLEMMVPLFSRGFMMYNLLRTYGLLVDLHLLEAEIY
ncbi:MAG TPA: hypothetical protein VG498_20505 [Terriglobales bacterium]|nr:hypothetical protein [Terriglobales bacterium]